MFFRAKDFNQDISSWKMAQAVDISQMFFLATSFMGVGIGRWDVSNVELLDYTFAGATMFHGDIQTWDISRVSSCDSAFQEAISFNSDISKWRPNSVKSMDSMFQGATSFSQDLCGWSENIRNSNSTTWTKIFHNSGCPRQDDPVKEGKLATFCFPC